MKIYKTLAIIILLMLLISGCASTSKKSDPPEANLIQQHIAKGESLEQQALFSSALEQYKLALTIDPENTGALQHKKKVLSKLWSTAQLHYKQGLELDGQGKYEAARKEYLSALQNWPDYKEAKEKLTPGGIAGDTKNYIIHTLMYGESVSQLAKIYYDDFKKHTIIGKFNILEDVTKVRVGKKLKIPVINNISLSNLKQKQKNYLNLQKTKVSLAPVTKPEEEIKTETIETSTEPETILQPADEVTKPRQDPVEETAPMTMPSSEEKVSENYEQGIELFKKKKYSEAIPLFLAAKEVDPDNEALIDYLFKSHFQHGLALFNSNEYLSAKDNFESAFKYDKNCEKCPNYIEKCETTYKEKHYNLGIHYFGKELLNKAIEEWNLVKAIDPDYKEVSPNLKKAEMLFKRLESIKQSTTE